MVTGGLRRLQVKGLATVNDLLVVLDVIGGLHGGQVVVVPRKDLLVYEKPNRCRKEAYQM